MCNIFGFHLGQRLHRWNALLQMPWACRLPRLLALVFCSIIVFFRFVCIFVIRGLVDRFVFVSSGAHCSAKRKQHCAHNYHRIPCSYGAVSHKTSKSEGPWAHGMCSLSRQSSLSSFSRHSDTDIIHPAPKTLVIVLRSAPFPILGYTRWTTPVRPRTTTRSHHIPPKYQA